MIMITITVRSLTTRKLLKPFLRFAMNYGIPCQTNKIFVLFFRLQGRRYCIYFNRRNFCERNFHEVINLQKKIAFTDMDKRS